MTICTSITESYLDKAQPFFESAFKYFDGKRICFTIGFETTVPGWECVYVPMGECGWRPKNRDKYYSLQHGEFIKYYDFDPDEMVLFVDADMVMQRKWDLTYTREYTVHVTRCSFPPLNLYDVANNIGCSDTEVLKNTFGNSIFNREFCTCFLLMSAKLWNEVYTECKKKYHILDLFEHHAAWQFLINMVVWDNFSIKFLTDYVCNAEWYTGTMATGNPLAIDENIVYFNHTK